MKRKLTPQEKKRLSYVRDRRNGYGQNAKASRKAIPLKKRLINRAYRRNTQQLASQIPQVCTEEMDALEQSVHVARRKNWRKCRDIPLVEYIRRQRTWRILRKYRKKTGQLNRS